MIFLQILKILGIVLLVLLAVIVFLILLILFIPVRYNIFVKMQPDEPNQSEKSDEPEKSAESDQSDESDDFEEFDADEGKSSIDLTAKCIISWLLHLLEFKFEYDGGEAGIVFRICGINANSILKRENDNNKHKKKKKKTRTKVKTGNKEKPGTMKQADGKIPDSSNIEIDTNNDNVELLEENEDINISSTYADGNDMTKHTVSQDNMGGENDSEENSWENENSYENNPNHNKKKKRRIDLIFKELLDKIRYRFIETKNIISSIYKHVTHDGKKASKYIDFLKDEDVKAFWELCKREIKYLMRHIKPNKVKSDIIFGTSQPDVTAYILGAVAVFNGSTGINLNIKPDFENSIIKGYISIKGRVQAFVVLKIVLKVLFSKEWKIFEYKYDKMSKRR